MIDSGTSMTTSQQDAGSVVSQTEVYGTSVARADAPAVTPALTAETKSG